jgi:squalene monooxygenase
MVKGTLCGPSSSDVSKADVGQYFAPLTFIADGYASNFRKALHPHDPSRVVPTVRSRFHGLELTDAPLPRPEHGHVLLGAAHPPILLYQISEHSTRILVDVPEGLESASPASGGVANHLRAVVLPALPPNPPELRASLLAALDAGARPRAMPNSWLPARGPKRRVSPDGIAVIGDALNMRHPLTGGGMTCALRDALALSRTLEPKRVGLHFDQEVAVRQGLRDFHWRRKSGAAVINILAQALYSLFAADGGLLCFVGRQRLTLPDENLRSLQLGCFRYFQLGGECVDGPVGLLAGLIRSPLVLLYHFFSVALLAIWIEARRYPLPLLPIMLLWRGGSILWTACVVILPYVGAELRN